MSESRILSEIDRKIYQRGFMDGVVLNPNMSYISHPVYNLAYLDALVYKVTSKENETDDCKRHN